MFLKKYIGDKAFYRMVLAVSVPMMIQNGITNLVSLLDNIMVGSINTEAMSGVSIVNQFVFVFNLLLFGTVSAAGIFTAQYQGLGDVDGVRHTFRFKCLSCLLIGIVGVVVFATCDDFLISLFLHDGSYEGNLEVTMAYAKEYTAIMLAGLIPFALSQAYMSTLRETGETVLPMIASVAAVATNFILNGLLIFGLFGLPVLGVAGAAIATVVSRFVELGILVVWTHTHKEKNVFAVGAFSTLRIPGNLAWRIVLKGMPLMLNEFFWALAVTMRNQCYSLRGLDVVAAQNISSTIYNLFSVIYMALGAAIAIVIGQLLGAGKMDEARDADRKMVFFSVACSVGLSLLLIATSALFPMIYNTTDEVRSLATYMIIISAAAMPFSAYANASYFTLRSGGKVMITILFDCVYMWAIVMPVVASLAYLTKINIYLLFAIGQGVETLKAVLGFVLLQKGTWVQQLVSDSSDNENE